VSFRPAPRVLGILACLLAPAVLAQEAAQESEVPLGLSLPTAAMVEGWRPAIRFTHRFTEPARGHSKDLFGLDGGNYAGFGLDLGIGALPGLNAQIYRTADNKTLVLALQQRLLAGPRLRASLRVERFDEGVERTTLPGGTLGITGVAAQLPVEAPLGSVTFRLVPTWLSRTSTQDKGLLTAGAGLTWAFLEGHAILGEVYPRPSRLDSARYEPGYGLGYRYATRGHRFTLLATTATGTTAHQVLGGDYAGGPRRAGDWTLGFNLVRMF
jgi:hypothetical protein